MLAHGAALGAGHIVVQSGSKVGVRAAVDDDFGALLDLAAEKQVLILQAGTSVLRFVPPLNITDEELAEGLKRVREAIAAFVATR